MELLQLRYFQTVANLGSVTKAANRYRIPQSDMSQTLKRLERDLGNVSLFDRSNNRIQLNENGRVFLAYVDSALMALDNGVAAMHAKSGELQGHIRILALENRRFILSCVSEFAGAHPGVQFSIAHDPMNDSSVSYDLCIAPSVSYQQMRAGVPLIREEIIINVNDKHPAAERPSVDLSEMINEKFITMSPHSSIYMITCDSCRACGFEPNIPFICDDPYYVRKYVSENMGVALAPAISWAGRFRSNTRNLHISNPQIIVTSYLLWDKRKYMTATVAAFRDFVVEKAKTVEGNLYHDA